MLLAAARILPATGPAGGVAPILAPGYLTFEDGLITGVGAGRPPGRPDLELTGGYLFPGLVAPHGDGFFAVATTAPAPDGWGDDGPPAAQAGTTTLPPTLLPPPTVT